MNFTFCDACGREIKHHGDDRTGYRKLRLYMIDSSAKRSNEYPAKEADVCAECATKIEEIVKDAVPGPGRDEEGRPGDPELRNRDLLKLR